MFETRNLAVLAYANGFTLWHYKASADTQAEVAAHGFFDPGASLLADGDMLLVSASDGGRVLSVSSEGGGDGGSGDNEMSTEAVAMAYLLKGVHF